HRLRHTHAAPCSRDEKMHEVVPNITSLKSNHNLKFGADPRFRTSGETASPPGESAFGRWVFDGTYTTNPASPGGTGETIASMLLGFPQAIRRDVFLGKTGILRTDELNFYARDEWRITNKLTLNIGLHYEINTAFTETGNKWV